jgi:CubicO group peptidase (beta-lactamase class C family)
MNKKFFLYFFLLISVLSGCAQIGTPSLEQPSKGERIDELFVHYVDSGEFSGAVLVAQEGQVLLRKGYGFANREEQIPNTLETIFSIQSMSKLFTYAAILMEEDQGHLSLDDPIQLYIPGFPNGDKITIQHLLYHRSGLLHYPHDVPGHIYGSLSEPIAMEELTKELGAFPLKSEPGTQFSYSNAGYTMLAHVIESVSGVPFDEYLQANIFSPVGMNETTADWSSTIPDLATGYEKVHDTYIQSLADHVSHFVGAGTVYSTIDDMHRWYQAVYTDGSMRKFSFGGANGRGMGYQASFMPIPSFDIVIILLSNHMDAPVAELGRKVTAILLEDTAIVQLEADDLDAFVGQYEGLSAIGEVSFQVDRVAENLIVTQSGFFGATQTYELEPLSPHRFVTIEGENLTGSVYTFRTEPDGSVSQVTLDLNGFELEAVRTD